MIHEFNEIIQSYKEAKQNNIRSIIATVVDLDGSSYRKPGVRMLINENGQMTGAVSGGCVEKEILKQSYTVFKSGISKIITYDGRYRIGCEGVLYILIELFDPVEEMIVLFEEHLEKRETFVINSFYRKELGVSSNFGSVIIFKDDKQYAFYRSDIPETKNRSNFPVFTQKLDLRFRLILIGAEHDAVQLCTQANALGWEVIIIAGPSDPQSLKNFPGAKEILQITSNDLDISLIDKSTAIVLMTHNYARDLQFLTVFKDSLPVYLGLLGSKNRRERLLNDFIESNPDVEDYFFDKMYGPAGLNIGAITPQEIALPILAEILSVIRKKEPKPLKSILGAIHQGEY